MAANTLVTGDIERFSEYFREQVALINQLADSLHSRILWVTLFDALSRAGSPHLANKNRERILKFLETFAQWKHCSRVSLPQAKLNLEESQLTQGKLYNFVIGELSKWSKGTIYGPTDDPEFNSVVSIAYCDCERKILKHCRYKELFYSYRNHLVHGFRPPGHAIEDLSSRQEPFYHSSDNGPIMEWELVFPKGLFSELCLSGIDQLVRVLDEENRSPYEAYDFSARW